MKRCLAILLVAVLLIGLMPLTGALAATEYATVVGGWLRLREKASFNATTISSYKTGTTVKVLSISNGWYRVETPDGRTGYMYGQYLQPTSSSMTPVPNTNATVVSGNGYGVRMRSGPSTTYSVLRKWPVGTRAIILAEGQNWCRISVGGNVGYMMSQFLRKDGSPAPSYDGDATVWAANGKGVRLRTGAGTNYSIILDVEITKYADKKTTKVTGYSYTPIYTVVGSQSADGFQRVVRIEQAMQAYNGNFVDKVTEACYKDMEYSLTRIAERTSGKG